MSQNDNTLPLPAWWDELVSKYQCKIAHTFLLHGNSRDYVHSNLPLTTFLSQIWKKRVLVAYSRSKGIHFLSSNHEKKFRELAGLTANVDSGSLTQVSSTQTPAFPTTPSTCIDLIRRTLLRGKQKTDLVVVIDDIDLICPAAEVSTMPPDDRNILAHLLNIAEDPAIQASDHIVILVCESLATINARLKSRSTRIEQIKIPMPDYAARLAFVQALKNQPQQDAPITWDVTPEHFARTTAALSLYNIEDIYMASALKRQLTEEIIAARKREIITAEYADVLSLEEGKEGLECIGGLEIPKAFFRKAVIQPIKDGDYKLVPMGVLLLGPAGTGKTVFAKAAAVEADLNFAVVNFSKILGKFVGESEARLEKLIMAFEALAPCIIFIDEADQGVTRGNSGDSGVSNRQFKRLMEFLSDTTHRGRILAIAASNRPDLLDAAFRRPGRFDNKILFPVPDEPGREEIIRIHVRNYMQNPNQPIGKEELKLTEGWTGAEIEAGCVKAARLEAEGVKHPLAQAFKSLRPTTADIEFMTLLALREVNDLDLVPEKYRSLLMEPDKVEDEIEKSPSRLKSSMRSIE